MKPEFQGMDLIYLVQRKWQCWFL